jgi:hypothetical protein
MNCSWQANPRDMKVLFRNKNVVPRSDAKMDVVGDRNHFIIVGMAAVCFTLLVFSVQRLVVSLQTGLSTPWWGNAAGLVALTALWAWYRRKPQTRSSGAAHGTALIAIRSKGVEW